MRRALISRVGIFPDGLPSVPAFSVARRRARPGDKGFSLVVVRICIDFRGEAYMEDPLLVVTQPVKKRFTGGIFSQKVYREEPDGPRLIAEAEVTWVCVDARKRPTKMPAFLDLPSLEPDGGRA